MARPILNQPIPLPAQPVRGSREIGERLSDWIGERPDKGDRHFDFGQFGPRDGEGPDRVFDLPRGDEPETQQAVFGDWFF